MNYKRLIAFSIIISFLILLWSFSFIDAKGGRIPPFHGKPYDSVYDLRNITKDMKSNIDPLKPVMDFSSQEFTEIDGVKIPKYLLQLSEVKNKHLLRLIVSLKEPSLMSGGEKDVISFQQEQFLNFLNDLKAKNEDFNFEILSKTEKVYNQVTIRLKIKDYPYFSKEVSNFKFLRKISFPNLYNFNLDYSVPLINADDVWTSGYTGDGIVVGIIDTGIDYNHPDLGGPGFPNSKVIDGYDFGDNDPDPMDCAGHGTHVAAIVAANGTVKGVAPDAKLIAAKIVPGCEGWATSDAVVSAFEYMVNKGVDVINMSFGSTAGFVNPTDPEQVTISNAVNSGIIVAISAGNESWSTYPATLYFLNHGADWSFFPPDIGVVGDPSTVPGVISVAASYNTHAKYRALTELSTSIDMAYIVGSDSQDPITTLGDNGGNGYEYYYCGLGGDLSDFPPEVNGKIALIQRGSYNFSTKIHNAQLAGAIGVIIFNHSQGGDELVYMGTEGETLPAVFIGNTDGQNLLLHAQNAGGDGNGRVAFYSGVYKDIPVTNADKPTSFTSWGTTPGMYNKPDLTAPGGDIWSTVPGGGYASHSGTSMASPHVAGAAALMKQIDASITPERAKMLLMETSDVLHYNSSYFDNVPYPVRQQGAGRINLERALDNIQNYKTYVVAGSALLNFGDTEGIFGEIKKPITIVNEGASDVTFNLSYEGGIYFPSTSDPCWDYSSTTSWPDVSFYDSDGTTPINSVTVPSGGEKTIYVGLDTTYAETYYDNVFYEGYIYFSTGSGFDLNIPWLAFIGDWQDTTFGDDFYNNPVIDPPIDTGWSFCSLMSYSYGYNGGGTWGYWRSPSGHDYYLGYSFDGDFLRDRIAFSPDGDGDRDWINPGFSLVRGTKEFSIDIVNDEKTEVVKHLFDDTYLRKNFFNFGRQSRFYIDSSISWDGLDSQGNKVPDGRYWIKFKAKIPGDPTEPDPQSYQVLYLPVRVDTIAPVVNWHIDVVNRHVVLRWDAYDWDGDEDMDGDGIRSGSGIRYFSIYKDGNIVATVGPDEDSYEFTDLSSIYGHTFDVEAVDYAYNYSGFDRFSFANLHVRNKATGKLIPVFIEVDKTRKMWKISAPTLNYTTGWMEFSRVNFQGNHVIGRYADKRIKLILDFYYNSNRIPRVIFNDRLVPISFTIP